MRINGLIQTTEIYHLKFSDLIQQKENTINITYSTQSISQIQGEIQSIVSRVDHQCKKRGATAADLPNPSYRAYQWFNFLGKRKWLLSHLNALKDFHQITDKFLAKKGFRTAPGLDIRILHFNYLFRSNQERGIVKLEINEGFIFAPLEIKENIVETALDKRNRIHAKAIQQYTNSVEYKQISNALQANHPINLQSFKGEHFNLTKLFIQLNVQYFENQLKQPRLVWSPRRSSRRLGYYDPQSNTITINRRFDSPETPRLLIEYILYHEMLHQSLGVREVNGRRYAHTAAFKKAERKFKGYETAEKMIKQASR